MKDATATAMTTQTRSTCQFTGPEGSTRDATAPGQEDRQDREHPVACRASLATPPGVRSSSARYGLRMTRVAALPVFLPCHSANANALLTSESGKLCETTLESG